MTEPSVDRPDEQLTATPADQMPPDETSSGGGSLRRQMGSVAAASAIALLAGQVLSMAQTVVLARLLTPTDVGYFAAGSVVTSFISNFVEGGLRAGLIHRQDRLDDAAETVFRATLLVGVVLSLIALASAPVIGLIFNSHTSGVVAASMSGGILLFSLTNVPEAMLQREFSVRRRLIVGPTVALTFAVVSVTLAALGFGVWSMVIGTYASSTVWVIVLWWLCDWRPGRGRPDMQMYREMVGYGLPMAIGNFVNQSVSAIQAIVTGRVLGVFSLGLLRYGIRIAQIPVGAIIEVGANSLFPAYSRIASDPERFRRGYLHAITLVVVAAAAISGLLLALGEPLVVVVLGEKWRGAGTALVAMSGLGIGVAISTSAEAIKGAGRTKLLNWVTLIEAILGIGLAVTMAPLFGLVGVGLAISFTSLISGWTLVSIIRSILGLPWRPVLGAILPPVVAALLVTGVVAALEHLVFHSDHRHVVIGLLLLVVDGLVYAVLYPVALRVLAPTAYAQAEQVVLSVVRTGLAKLRPGRAVA